MASRLTVFLEEAFGKSSVRKSRLALAVCALFGLALASELGLAQSNTSHPPVISTSTEWTLDAPTLASSSAGGVPSNGFSMQGGFSPDGTHLLFWSRSTNVAPTATSGFSELYLKDLTTGQVTLVSADANGIEGNSDSNNPNNSSQIVMFSPDGTKVVFESVATNLIPAGANGRQHIFVKDLTSGAVTLVSVDANGIQGNGNSTDFTFSPDGTKVAFDSASTNLIPGGTAGKQVFIKDLTTGGVTLVSTDPNGVAGNGASSLPVFSPDGTQVAFASISTNLAPSATNTHSQIYVKNLQSGAISVASADVNGNEANNDSLYPMFSPDGSKLAFNSISTNLVANVPSFNSEVYVKDLASAAITLVSTDVNGVPANGNSTQLGAFSPDSTKIVFQSASTNLTPGANGASQVFVKDLLTGAITLTSVNAAGVVGNSNSTMPTFSPGHLAFAFQSGSSNFGVTNFTSQIFVRSIFTASGAVADSSFATSLSTAGQLSFSDADTSDTHTASVTAQAGDLGTVTASVSKDSAGSGTGGVVLWNYQVSESLLHALTAPATDNFTLTLTDSQGCTATTAIVVTALPQDFAITNATSSTPTSTSTSTSSCPTLSVTASPSNVTVTSGQTASFSAAATGTPTPTVQWQVSIDGGTTFTDLPGATSTTLAFAADMSQNGNLYRAVFTNASGSVMSSAAALTVNSAGATTSVTSSKSPTVFGEVVAFTATVSATTGTPTGSVTFLDGTASLGTGTLDPTGAATFTTFALAVGTHAITASYSGDSNFNANTSAPFTQIVNLDVAAVTVSATPNPSVFGQPVVVTAMVSATAPGSGTPTGTVTFLDGLTNLGTTNLVNGQASFTLATLNAGLHSIMATYGGDGSFSQNSGVAGETVNKASTTTSLTSSANPSIINQTVTFTATVGVVAPGAGAPTGSISFSDDATNLGTVSLVNGQATFTTSTLAVGPHSITASYGGEGGFNSSSSTLAQTVNKASTTTTLSSSANPSAIGLSVTFTATVNAVAPASGTPTGTVRFSDGGTTLATEPLSSQGTASFSTSTLAVNSHSITAVYSGDSNFNGSTGSLTLNVQYAICAQYDQTRSVQSGATFPIKLQICDASGNNLSSPAIVVHATAILAASGVAGPVQDSGNANPDNDFRPTGGSGQNAGYIFNLSTDGLATGTYALQFTVQGDPVLHTVFFGVN